MILFFITETFPIQDLIRNIKLKRKGKMNRKSIKERFGSKNENVRQSKKITSALVYIHFCTNFNFVNFQFHQ